MGSGVFVLCLDTMSPGGVEQNDRKEKRGHAPRSSAGFRGPSLRCNHSSRWACQVSRGNDGADPGSHSFIHSFIQQLCITCGGDSEVKQKLFRPSLRLWLPLAAMLTGRPSFIPSLPCKQLCKWKLPEQL